MPDPLAEHQARLARLEAEDPLAKQYDHWLVDDIRALPHGDHLLARLHYNRWPNASAGPADSQGKTTIIPATPDHIRDHYEPNWREREMSLLQERGQ